MNIKPRLRFESLQERIAFKKREHEKFNIQRALVQESDHSIAMLVWYCFPAVAISLFILAILLFCGPCVKSAHAEEINLNKIMMIESSGNPRAFNPQDRARGLYQITPICLREFNNLNSNGQRYNPDDLWNITISNRIADWYFNKRIPQLLKHLNIKDSVHNRIIAWNAGINTLKTGRAIPQTTKNYLKKYGV